VALPPNHFTGFGPFELIPLQVIRSKGDYFTAIITHFQKYAVMRRPRINRKSLFAILLRMAILITGILLTAYLPA
jgi:hypothetical protein